MAAFIIFVGVILSIIPPNKGKILFADFLKNNLLSIKFSFLSFIQMLIRVVRLRLNQDAASIHFYLLRPRHEPLHDPSQEPLHVR